MKCSLPGLDEIVSMKWRASKPRRVGLHEMVRGLGGRNARQVDGCRESEVSREWLIGDTICWLWNGC
jgi:hypothetical protein